MDTIIGKSVDKNCGKFFVQFWREIYYKLSGCVKKEEERIEGGEGDFVDMTSWMKWWCSCDGGERE